MSTTKSVGRTSRSNDTIRVISAVAVSGMIMLCMVLGQLNVASQPPASPTSDPAVVVVGGNPSWDLVGSMILYRSNSDAGDQPYWVAQSFQVVRNASSIVLSLEIYIWLARDVPPDSSFPQTVDNITVLLTNATAAGNPNILDPIANRTIGPQNITAAGPYPRGLMKINDTFAVHLSLVASNPLVGFSPGEYFIFLYRSNLGDNEDYHNGYAYYWAASKLDLYYGGGSWMLNNKGEWRSYPNDLCFALIEVTFP
ncbi:MAG: hypothetical protein WED05_05045 [Candidatus Atabeyarchaeum deiterrae]